MATVTPAVKHQRHQRVALAVENDTRCPYTLSRDGKDWDGKCYNGEACRNPYLDTVFLGSYCRQREMTLREMELERKGEPILE